MGYSMQGPFIRSPFLVALVLLSGDTMRDTLKLDYANCPCPLPETAMGYGLLYTFNFQVQIWHRFVSFRLIY